MTPAARMAREDAITDALRVADDAIGAQPPSDQALAIIAAIKRLRDGAPARVRSLAPIDYLTRLQDQARTAWLAKHQQGWHGPEHDAVAGLDTPLGRLRVVAWRRLWNGDRRGERISWAGEYYLNDEPITVAEIRAAGLADRPTQRNRKRKA